MKQYLVYIKYTKNRQLKAMFEFDCEYLAELCGEEESEEEHLYYEVFNQLPTQ